MIWAWTAIDADTKLIAAYRMGTQDAGCAYEFMMDLAPRIVGRMQLTTDGHNAYINAVADAFGPANIDYAMLVKLFETLLAESVQPARVHRNRDAADHRRAGASTSR